MACRDAKLNLLAREVRMIIDRIIPNAMPTRADIARLIAMRTNVPPGEQEAIVDDVMRTLEATREPPRGRSAIFVAPGTSVSTDTYIAGEIWPATRATEREGYVLTDAAEILDITNRHNTIERTLALYELAESNGIRRTFALDFLIASERGETVEGWLRSKVKLMESLRDANIKYSESDSHEALLAKMVAARIERSTKDAVKAGRMIIVANPSVLAARVSEDAEVVKRDYHERVERAILQRALKASGDISSSAIREAYLSALKSKRTINPILSSADKALLARIGRRYAVGAQEQGAKQEEEPEAAKVDVRAITEAEEGEAFFGEVEEEADLGKGTHKWREAITVTWRSMDRLDLYMNKLLRVFDKAYGAEFHSAKVKGGYEVTVSFKKADIQPIKIAGTFTTPETAKIAALLHLRRRLFLDIATKGSSEKIVEELGLAAVDTSITGAYSEIDVVVPDVTIDEAMLALGRAVMFGQVSNQEMAAEAMRLYRTIYEGLDPFMALMYPHPSELTPSPGDLLAVLTITDYSDRGWFIAKSGVLPQDVSNLLEGEAIEASDVTAPSVIRAMQTMDTLLTDVLAEIAPEELPMDASTPTVGKFVLALQTYVHSGDPSRLLRFTYRDDSGELKWNPQFLSRLIETARFGARAIIHSPSLDASELAVGDVVHLIDRKWPFRTTAWPYEDDALISSVHVVTSSEAPSGEVAQWVERAVSRAARRILNLDPFQGPASILKGRESDYELLEMAGPKTREFMGEEIHAYEAHAMVKRYMDEVNKLAGLAESINRALPEVPENEVMRARLDAFIKRSKRAPELIRQGDLAASRNLYHNGIKILRSAGEVGIEELSDLEMLMAARQDFAEARRVNEEAIRHAIDEGIKDPIIVELVRQSGGTVTRDLVDKVIVRLLQMSASIRAASRITQGTVSPSDAASGWIVEEVVPRRVKLARSAIELQALPEEWGHMPSAAVTLRSMSNLELRVEFKAWEHPYMDFLILTRRHPDGTTRGVNLINAALNKLVKGGDFEPRIAQKLDDFVEQAHDVVMTAITEGNLLALRDVAENSPDTVLGKAIIDASDDIVEILSKQIGSSGNTVLDYFAAAAQGVVNLKTFTEQLGDGSKRKLSPEVVARLQWAQQALADSVSVRVRVIMDSLKIKGRLPEGFDEEAEWC